MTLSWSLAGAAATDRVITDDYNKLLFDIYKELVETNTTHSSGDNTLAANRMAAWLRLAGFPDEAIFVGGPVAKKGNLVVRYPGNGSNKPLAMIAHIDVVEANPADWSIDPFKLTEKDGYYYGRGTTDDKAMSAIWIANLIRLKREGYVPNRDLIVALTADEEGGGNNGIRWLLTNHRQLIDAAIALNEGGSGSLKNGVRIANSIQTAEKIYLGFSLSVRNSGGHSSIPRADNAIYQLAEALLKIRDFKFPMMLNPVMRLSLERRAKITAGQMGEDMLAILAEPPDPAALARLSADPIMNAQLRTTAVATMLAGGHAPNALPQSASAVVNVRMMPGSAIEDVHKTLIEVIDDAEVKVEFTGGGAASDPSPLTDEILTAIEQTSEEMWPGVPVVPTMATGATDGAKMRNAGIPTYGVSGLFHDIDDIRAHGRDERMLIRSLYEGQEFLYRLVKALSE